MGSSEQVVGSGLQSAQWSEEASRGVELGVVGQPRLGEWGVPFVRDGVAVVKLGLVWAWSSGDGECLHWSRGWVVERTWEMKDREAMLCGATVKVSVPWYVVPALVPAGMVLARELPDLRVCPVCARVLALELSSSEAVVETLKGRKVGVAMRPIVWRSRALFGVRGEDPMWGEDGGQLSEAPDEDGLEAGLAGEGEAR